MPAYFLDLSNNQGAGVRVDEIEDGCYLKASEGAGFTDGYRATWQAGLEARGLPTGTYHFHRGANTPKDQLARWIDSGLDTGAWRPVLDCEDNSRTLTPSDMSANCLELAELVANHCGVEPIIYTGGWWIGQYATREPAWALYDLWLSAYPLGDQRAPTDEEAASWFAAGKYCQPPAPWQGVLAWQFTSIASAPGVPGHVDRSIVADLASLSRNPAAHQEDEVLDPNDPIVQGLQGSISRIEAIADVNRWNRDVLDGLVKSVSALAQGDGATAQQIVDELSKRLADK